MRVPVKYKVFFHQGNDLGLKTRVAKGEAWLDSSGLHVEGASQFLIPANEIKEVELFRLHGLGRVIRVEHCQGRLYVSVVHFMIGQFATISFFKTGALHEELSTIAGPNTATERARQ